MDGITRAILRQVSDLGWAVQVQGSAITIINSETGERFTAENSDMYLAACRVAKRVGIRLKE